MVFNKMKRNQFSFTLYITVCSCFCILLGCDEYSDVASNSVAHGLASESAPAASETSDEAVEETKRVSGGDAPSLPITMQWLDLQKDKAVSTDELSMEITNVSKREFDVGVTIVSSGLNGKTRLANVGEWSLSSSNSVVASLPAHRIPVQVSDGSAQARMRVDITSTSPYTGEPETVSFYSSMIHYRHDKSFKRIEMFNEEVLMSQFQGKVFFFPAGAERSGVVLGRLVDEKGNVSEVKSTDNSFVKKSADGNVIGYDMGMVVHAGEAIVEKGGEK